MTNPSEDSDQSSPEEKSSAELLADRIAFLIRTDENLCIAESIGVLFMLAFEIAHEACYGNLDEEES